MILLSTPPTTLTRADGTVDRNYVRFSQEFRNKAAALRFLADHDHQAGWRRSVAGYWMPDPDDGRSTYCTYYWSSATRYMSHEQWEKLARLSVRYRRFVRHMTEVAPQWKEVERINWMDNSVESVQVCKHGTHRRTVTVVAPHGDLC